jgi:HD-like signal output (HDOD) protein
MSTDAAATQTVVNDAIKSISHIATLPEITVRIIELVEDPTSTANDLNNVISNDPALCSRILKVVNSSFYGLPGQIGSINRAIVLLGLNAVKNIAISASMAKLFRGGQVSPAFSARDLWMHSIATAACCKLLTERLGLGVGDEAFLAGLVHDIGVMVELQSDRNKLIEVINRVAPNKEGEPQADMLDAEADVFGANHQQFGKALCEKWKFPKVFALVTGTHHNPLELPSGDRTMASLVYIADRLAATVEDSPYRLDLISLDFDPSVLDELALTRERLEDIRESLAEQVEEVAMMLG